MQIVSQTGGETDLKIRLIVTGISFTFTYTRPFFSGVLVTSVGLLSLFSKDQSMDHSMDVDDREVAPGEREMILANFQVRIGNYKYFAMEKVRSQL